MEPVPAGFDANAFFMKSLRQATPQREAELLKLIQRWNIRFTLDEKSLIPDFWADVHSGEINVPRRCLFRIKGSAYAYYSAFGAMVALHNRANDAELSSRLDKASALLTWAVRTDIATALDDGSQYSSGSIPPEFDELCRNCLKPEQVEIAEEVFRMSVIWILHHEIAHIRLQHTSPAGADSIREEFEADKAAIEWLVDDSHLNASERLLHRLAVAVGLGWLSAFNVYLEEDTGMTHPPECERFIAGTEVLAATGGDEAEWSWAACQAVLLLHAQNAGLDVKPEHMKGSFEEIARQLAKLVKDSK